MVYPGDFLAHCEIEIDCSLIEGQFGGGRPQFKLVALAMTLMAAVATDRHVHGEASAAGRGVVQGTASVPLIARSLTRLEAEQVEYLLHRDLRAKPVEVDSWHGSSSFGGEICWVGKKGRSVPFLYRGTGNGPPRVNQRVANRWPCGGVGRLALTIPGPRPGVRS